VTAAQTLARRGGILLIMNSLGRGGGDRVAMLLANGLAQAGIPTRIALMKDADEPSPDLLDPAVAVLSAGRPMGLGWSSKRPPLGHRHLERFRGVRLIRQQIDAFRPAIVLASSDNMGLVTALARRKGDGHVVFAMKLTNRLFRPNTPVVRAWLRRPLFQFIFNRLDLVLTLTDTDRIDALKHYPGRDRLFRTVANPYVTDAMLSDPPARRNGSVRLLSAGRLVRQKRFDVLLRAFALSTRRDATLTILGDGPLRADLERLAATLGIAERVEMPGHADVVPALRQSRLFVLSSDYEGLPAVLIEALACDVPVVTTDSFHAARELLGSAESCAVVRIGDPEALAEAIDRCLAQSSGARLRQVAEPYRLDSAIRAHIEALADAVEAQNRTDTPV
jgi:glycosyltransferase involved in cell wall biosynthesis